MPSNTVVTIGNFDGVHVGHVALVDAARRAVGNGGHVCVLSFDPHPVTVLRPDVAVGRLTRFDRRAELLRSAGADEVVRLEPTATFLDRSPEAFLKQLVKDHQPSWIVEGPDFHFGRGRRGNVQTLRDLEARFGYRTAVIDPIEAPLTNQHLVRVSSTMIRWLLERGRVADAAVLLDRPYSIIAPVVSGDRRGRQLGTPTANLGHDDAQLPADGIYAGRARRPDGRWYAAATSVGTKPTFGGIGRVCETYLLDYDGPVDDYGWTIELEFTQWLRAQVRYDDVEELVQQLRRDIQRVRECVVLA